MLARSAIPFVMQLDGELDLRPTCTYGDGMIEATTERTSSTHLKPAVKAPCRVSISSGELDEDQQLEVKQDDARSTSDTSDHLTENESAGVSQHPRSANLNKPISKAPWRDSILTGVLEEGQAGQVADDFTRHDVKNGIEANMDVPPKAQPQDKKAREIPDWRRGSILSGLMDEGQAIVPEGSRTQKVGAICLRERIEFPFEISRFYGAMQGLFASGFVLSTFQHSISCCVRPCV